MEEKRSEDRSPVLCAYCKHYHLQSGKSGLCRKHPPQVGFVTTEVRHGGNKDDYIFGPRTAWPTVKEDDWCAEFEEVE
jgi:hypothetical protein